MKQTIIIIGCLLLVLNLLFGLLLSSYQTFNMLVNCGVIVINTLLLLCVGEMNIKDGFKVSYNVLFPMATLLEVFVVSFAPQGWKDNGALLFVVLLLTLQIILLVISNYVSKIS